MLVTLFQAYFYREYYYNLRKADYLAGKRIINDLSIMPKPSGYVPTIAENPTCGW